MWLPAELWDSILTCKLNLSQDLMPSARLSCLLKRQFKASIWSDAKLTSYEQCDQDRVAEYSSKISE